MPTRSRKLSTKKKHLKMRLKTKRLTKRLLSKKTRKNRFRKTRRHRKGGGGGMMREIQAKIKEDMIPGSHWIELKYKDIILELLIIKEEHGVSKIKLLAFHRGHYVKDHQHHSIGAKLPNDDVLASKKGDGALFLALVVKHCNEIFGDIPLWIGGVTDWWRIKGVCAIKNACKKTEKSGYAYEINNEIFKQWANGIIQKNDS